MKKILGTIVVTVTAFVAILEISEEIQDHIWVRKQRKEEKEKAI